MKHGLGTYQRVEHALRLDPRVVLASSLLQLAQHDLELAIEAELSENPALERLDDVEPIHEDQILRRVAPSELLPASEDREFLRTQCDEEATNWVDLAVAPSSLRDHLVAQLLPIVPKALDRLAIYIAHSVNEKGYLEEPVEEISLTSGYAMEDVEHVIAALQSCEPAGVGARDVRECLILQLRGNESHEERLARSILRHGMEDFLARKPMRLARRFGVMPSLVTAACELILRLNPFPGESFSPHAGPTAATVGVTPDLVLARSEAGWSIDVKGPDPCSLCVSRPYLVRQRKLAEERNGAKDEKRHLSVYIQRANDFISCLEQRQRTLRAIGDYLIREQAGFVTTGSYQFLKPLTRVQVAEAVGVHESTVSRATADKFVQIATGEVISFDVFFKPALRVQKMISEILQSENPDAPFSDDRIAEMLAAQGVFVARRTVNKYRDRSKLLSSRKRRSA